MVGGTVRDAFLGVETNDLDFATDARPDEIATIVAEWADGTYRIGEAFGTIGVVRHGTTYEITTFRRDVYRDESRKPQVSFSETIEEDLARRDFTVNAMAIRVPVEPGATPEMIDPHHGLADLGARVLRTPDDPASSFGDDPLRMLRLYRFVATLGFGADAAAAAAVAVMKDRLSIVSAERIRDELARLIVGEHIADALWGLVDTDLASEFIPELTALRLEQDPAQHHKDVLAHTIAVVAKTSSIESLRLAALFHDIGKPATRQFGPDGVSFHHHEVVGARLTRERMRALRFPKETVATVAQLVFLHMRAHTYKMGWTDSAVRRYVRDAGPLLPLLNELVRCDVTTRSRKRANAISRRIDELEERIAELRKQEELDALRPPVDGHEVMKYLGIEPGPAVGRAMRLLNEHRIEHGPYDAAEAYRLLDGWREEIEAGSG